MKMKSQACEPCAKRKVRCDRNEPCSNCKRRKQDHCTFPDVSPAEKIKLLEAQVRSLGGDPSHSLQGGETFSVLNQRPSASQDLDSTDHGTTSARHIGPKATDPVLREEEGQLFYLESRTWQTWLGQDYRNGALHEKPVLTTIPTRKHPPALATMLGSRASINLTAGLPSQANAAELWIAFYQRVNPLIRISFSWELQRLQRASVDSEQQKNLSNAECTFLYSLYLLSAISLSEEECFKGLGRSKSQLISKLESLFEEALSSIGLLCVSDIIVLKALTMYIMAGADRLSTQSLWSLMGLVIRNAEKLGIHRDGTLLGLSPAETEERRRLWWHLQHLDLGLAVRSGLTPLTLVADWDARLPLNIEDDDINPTMTEFPRERRGLTSMAYCQFAYWIIDEQRRFFRVDKGRFELSWQSNSSLPQTYKETLFDQLEDKINQNFLQFCDPIRSLDTLLQILARFLICGMRMRSLHPLVSAGNLEDAKPELRRKLLSFAMQCLEYDLVLASQANLRLYRWWTKGWFSWHSFMIVIVESAHQTDAAQARRIWKLLADIYTSYPNLAELSDDRRNAQAAELVVSAWKAYQAKSTSNNNLIQPDLVMNLEARLERARTESYRNITTEGGEARDGILGEASPNHIAMMAEPGLNPMYDLEFQDIDWLFWESLD